MKATENIYNLKPGTELLFTPTGVTFILAKVTDKNTSWYTGHAIRSGAGTNIMRMATQSLARTNRGIANGTYLITKP